MSNMHWSLYLLLTFLAVFGAIVVGELWAENRRKMQYLKELQRQQSQNQQ